MLPLRGNMKQNVVMSNAPKGVFDSHRRFAP
jgi:hypothetical protein